MNCARQLLTAVEFSRPKETSPYSLHDAAKLDHLALFTQELKQIDDPEKKLERLNTRDEFGQTPLLKIYTNLLKDPLDTSAKQFC